MLEAVVPFRSLVRVFVGPESARLLYEDVIGDGGFDVFSRQSSIHYHLSQGLDICFYPTESTHPGIIDCLFALQFTDNDTDPAKWIEQHAILPVSVEFVGYYRHSLKPMALVDQSTGRRVVVSALREGSYVLIQAGDLEALDQLRYRVQLGSFAGFGEP